MDNPRHTDNSGYTRHRTKTNKHKRWRKLKVESGMDNPRNTDNSGYTRNKDKQVQTLEKTKGGIRNGQSKTY